MSICKVNRKTRARSQNNPSMPEAALKICDKKKNPCDILCQPVCFQKYCHVVTLMWWMPCSKLFLQFRYRKNEGSWSTIEPKTEMAFRVLQLLYKHIYASASISYPLFLVLFCLLLFSPVYPPSPLLSSLLLLYTWDVCMWDHNFFIMDCRDPKLFCLVS